MGEEQDMRIGFAGEEDYGYLAKHDRHVRPEMLREKIGRGEVIVLRNGEGRAGWLRYGYFWDELPFVNMLWVEEEYRGKGLGRRLIEFWEDEMRRLGHERVMTSSMSNEAAQHFFRRLGYRDCGALLLPSEPVEIVFIKAMVE
jgi:ribosomal protein S18 acetylase RimI-like enzyme